MYQYKSKVNLSDSCYILELIDQRKKQLFLQIHLSRNFDIEPTKVETEQKTRYKENRFQKYNRLKRVPFVVPNLNKLEFCKKMYIYFDLNEVSTKLKTALVLLKLKNSFSKITYLFFHQIK